MLVKVEELTERPLARPSLPHLGHAGHRELADWPGEPGFTGTSPSSWRRSSRPRRRPTSRSWRPASPARRHTSSRACTGRPATCPCSSTSREVPARTCCSPGMPTTDEFQHQFLGLVSPKLPNGAKNPAYDDVDLNGVRPTAASPLARVHPVGVPGGRRGPDARPQADGQGPDDVRGLRPRLRAAVPGDRREPAARRDGPAVPAADVELPPGHG